MSLGDLLFGPKNFQVWAYLYLSPDDKVPYYVAGEHRTRKAAIEQKNELRWRDRVGLEFLVTNITTAKPGSEWLPQKSEIDVLFYFARTMFDKHDLERDYDNSYGETDAETET